MRWILAGMAFALAVGLAVGTAAMRAENTRLRLRLEREHGYVQDASMELRRLSLQALQQVTPERMAASLRRHLTRERREAKVAWL
ncbi:MAG: hypothetical protein RIT25_1375 [Planctomycetota bacterium]|jgi:uncharacterized membrane-anchored protein YhcB (DUF1043 family)